MAQPLLKVEGIRAQYGSVPVLHDVQFELSDGDLLLVAGPNGAGKSTLMRCLIGLHKPSRGNIMFEGKRITGMRPHNRARLGISFIPEGRGVIPELTVAENLDLARYRPGWSIERRERSLDRFPVLGGALDRQAGTLSGGEQQMLSLARALETAPRLLLIDEPSLGLAPKIVDEMMNTLRALSREGQSILLVEQRAAQVRHVADRMLLMRHGRVTNLPNEQEFTEMDFIAFTQDDLTEGDENP